MWLPNFFPVVNNLVMDVDNIEVLRVSCFGWRAKNKKDSWWYLVNNSGWDKRTEDDVVAKIEVSLAADVN